MVKWLKIRNSYDITSISLGDANAGGGTVIILCDGELTKAASFLNLASAFSLASVVACLIASL